MSNFLRNAGQQARSRRQIEQENKTMVCQKCLMVGHWLYECKNDKVYVQRESISSKWRAQKKPIFTLELPPGENPKIDISSKSNDSMFSQEQVPPGQKRKRKRALPSSSSSSDSDSDGDSTSSSSSSSSSSSDSSGSTSSSSTTSSNSSSDTDTSTSSSDEEDNSQSSKQVTVAAIHNQKSTTTDEKQLPERESKRSKIDVDTAPDART